MSVANYLEAPSITREQFRQVDDAVRVLLGGPDIAPEGILFHADRPTDDGGWWVFDLWESDEHSTRFADTILAPAIAQAGLPPVLYRRAAWRFPQTPPSRHLGAPTESARPPSHQACADAPL